MLQLHCRWRNPRHPAPKKGELRRFADRAAALAGLPAEPQWALNLLFVGDRSMIRCNRELLGHEGTTDVITLCYFEADAPVLPGEVAIELYLNPDAAEREGKKRRRSDYATELARYMVHGLLHCAGFNDLNPQDRAKMRRQELSVLRQLAKRGMTPESLFRVD